MSLPAYQPRPWLFNGRLQTARVPLSKPSPLHSRYPSRRLILPLDDGTDDAVDCYHYWPKDTGQRGESKSRDSESRDSESPNSDSGPHNGSDERPLFVLLHGLGGHAHSAYSTCTADSLLAAGYPVLMPNFRGAGTGRGLASVLHHPGRSEDIDLLLGSLEKRHPDLVTPRTLLVGFSLGGHLLLKFLADYEVGSPDRHRQIVGAVTVSAPLALDGTSRALSEWLNYPFNLYLLRKIKADSLRENSNLSDDERRRLQAARTVRQVDDTVTAPMLGFDDAEAYYAANSAIDDLDAITLPTVLIHSLDDPFVAAGDYDHPVLSSNPALDVVLLPDGGHVGFFSGQSGNRWLDRTLIELEQQRFWDAGAAERRVHG